MYNRNLFVWSMYEFGLIFKIIILVVVLNENLVDLEKDMFYDDGVVEVGGVRLKCWKVGGYGS